MPASKRAGGVFGVLHYLSPGKSTPLRRVTFNILHNRDVFIQ